MSCGCGCSSQSNNNQYSSDSSDSETEDCSGGFCPVRVPRVTTSSLPFDPSNLENIILSLSDSFDFRVIMSNEKFRTAMLVTTGLTFAGSFIGNHYGGKLGAAVGGVVGGACGVGIVAVSMRDIWGDVKNQLSELFDVVYDYLSGLGIQDYTRAGMFLAQNLTGSSELAKIVMFMASDILGKQITSNVLAI